MIVYDCSCQSPYLRTKWSMIIFWVLPGFYQINKKTQKIDRFMEKIIWPNDLLRSILSRHQIGRSKSIYFKSLSHKRNFPSSLRYLVNYFHFFVWAGDCYLLFLHNRIPYLWRLIILRFLLYSWRVFEWSRRRLMIFWYA